MENATFKEVVNVRTILLGVRHFWLPSEYLYSIPQNYPKLFLKTFSHGCIIAHLFKVLRLVFDSNPLCREHREFTQRRPRLFFF